MKSSLRITSGPNSRTEFETAEQNLKQQNGIWNSKTEFEQQNRIWNSRTEFETIEQNLELVGKFLFPYHIFCVAVWDFVEQLQILLCLIKLCCVVSNSVVVLNSVLF